MSDDMKAKIAEAHEMLNETLADRIVGTLNELLELDREATIALVFGSHIECNEAMSDHVSVQVRTLPDNKFGVRGMGLLNGLCGIYPDGFGRIQGTFSFNCPDHGEQDVEGGEGDPCPAEGCDKFVEMCLVRFGRVPPEDHQVMHGNA